MTESRENPATEIFTTPAFLTQILFFCRPTKTIWASRTDLYFKDSFAPKFSCTGIRTRTVHGIGKIFINDVTYILQFKRRVEANDNMKNHFTYLNMSNGHLKIQNGFNQPKDPAALSSRRASMYSTSIHGFCQLHQFTLKEKKNAKTRTPDILAIEVQAVFLSFFYLVILFPFSNSIRLTVQNDARQSARYANVRTLRVTLQVIRTFIP